jgi:hypothetical protein
MVITKTLSVPLVFNATTSASCFLFVPFTVKQIKAKLVSVTNTAASAPTTLIGQLKSDLIPADESLCHFPLAAGSSFCTGTDLTFTPVNNNINGNFVFSLSGGNNSPIGGAASLVVGVTLILEFSG